MAQKSGFGTAVFDVWLAEVYTAVWPRRSGGSHEPMSCQWVLECSWRSCSRPRPSWRLIALLVLLPPSRPHSRARQALRIATELLSILKYLGSLRPPVVHRDIKPENVVLEGGQWGGRVYLIDFGGVQGTSAASEHGEGTGSEQRTSWAQFHKVHLSQRAAWCE